MRGAMKMVINLECLSSIVRVERMPGTAQAKLDNSGTKLFPFNPDHAKMRSIKKAALAMYPVSSRSAMKKNKVRIWGRKMRTAPTPSMTPSVTRLCN
ncbi:MAG: hypothetical protein BWY82_00014 [Verrucomicrobia bacterium ADurb.Bin474]|nr:MAG: hypothetical protein BWY82_00014 [Verrucomicrobia bacterium ADurb.Bin474]